jgi:carbonic anhydrase
MCVRCMRGDGMRRLLAGYRHFREDYFETNHSLFEELAQRGQSPRVLVVACSDSRADPAIVTEAAPGDLFVIRNVAALVPPYAPDGRPHGTASALEFGVVGLGVEHVVVLGHSLCGGMRALLDGPYRDGRRLDFLADWVEIAAEARDLALAAVTEAPLEQRGRLVEQRGICISVRNLVTYPWVAERIASGRISVHGWHFDIASGSIDTLDAETGIFAPLDPDAESVRAGVETGRPE